MALYEKLLTVQQELKAPKNQYNSFGKYSYRNCEDILEAVKPLLVKSKLVLLLSDTIINQNNRYYIEAKAQLIDPETGEKEVVTALAREEEVKKGMDASQITGSASSYARKYALNGLFCIDDTKDSDYPKPQDSADKNKGSNANNNAAKRVTETQVADMLALADEKNVPVSILIGEISNQFGKTDFSALLTNEFDYLMKRLNATKTPKGLE